MHKKGFGKLLLLLCALSISLMMLSCTNSSDEETLGLIFNKTPYRVQVNFIGIKIVELQAGEALNEYQLKDGKSYEFQVTVFDGADVLQTIDSLLYIPPNPSYQYENNRRYQWFIEISGDEVPFKVTSISYD